MREETYEEEIEKPIPTHLEPDFVDPELICQVCGEHEYIGYCVCGRKMCSRCVETGAGFCGECDPKDHIEVDMPKNEEVNS